MFYFKIIFIKNDTNAVRHPMPEPIANEPKNTMKKLHNDCNIRARSNLSKIALATYFSIDLNICFKDIQNLL